jgi:protein pelota
MTKDDLFKYINENCSKEEFRTIRDNRSKILLTHSSSGQKQALSEILEDDNMKLQLSDTKYALEVKTLQMFYRMLSLDPLRACYGYDHVLKASEQGAVDTLMMTDSLFRYV